MVDMSRFLTVLVLLFLFGCSDQASTGSGSEVPNAITISLNANSDYSIDSVYITIRPEKWGTSFQDSDRGFDSLAQGYTLMGEFKRDNMMDGEYAIILEERQHGFSEMRRISLFGGTLTILKDLELEKGATVAGVLNRNSFPINSDIKVQIVGSDKLVLVNSDGEFTFENYPAGEHELVLSVEDSKEKKPVITLPKVVPGENKNLDSVYFKSSTYFDKGEWLHAQPIQFKYEGSSATIDDGARYPLICRLNGIELSSSHPAGADLRILSSTDELVPFEIQQWDREKGSADIAIQIESVTRVHNLTLYYGNEKVRTASDPIGTYAPIGDLLLFHLDDTLAGNMKDALHSGVQSNPSGQNAETLPLSVEGHIGNALQFDGVDDYLVLPLHDKLQLGERFSILCWVNLSAHDSENGRILSKSSDWEIKENKGHFQFSSGGAYILSSELLPVGEWIQLAVTVLRTSDTPEVSLFVNGVKQSIQENTFTTSYNSTAIKTDQPLFVGSLGNEEKYYNFALDELRLFHKVLTEDEIILFYSAESGLTPLFTMP